MVSWVMDKLTHEVALKKFEKFKDKLVVRQMVSKKGHPGYRLYIRGQDLELSGASVAFCEYLVSLRITPMDPILRMLLNYHRKVA